MKSIEALSTGAAVDVPVDVCTWWVDGNVRAVIKLDDCQDFHADGSIGDGYK